MINKLALSFICLCFACIGLTSCGGGGGGESTKYALSVRDFMRGNKCILIAGPNCAFAIVPERFDSSEITGPKVLCNAKIHVYKNAESPYILTTYEAPQLTYEVDEMGIGYLSCDSIKTSYVDDNWMFFCGVLAGTGGQYGAGLEGNYATLSEVRFILNFSGPDIGSWEDRCRVIMGQMNELLQASGTLYLRPKENLGLGN